jgi:hypothetical protein
MTTLDSAPHAGATPDTSALPRSGVLRCSDAERERTGAIVHEAAGAGRLTMEETEDRLGEVYAARYRHELEALTADLPATRPAGWKSVFAMAREQFADDVTALTSRDPGRAKAAARMVVIALAVLMVLMTVVMVVVHGVILDGPEYGGGFH